MKSPSDLAAKLARQWDDPDCREERLLNPDAWPVVLNIGKPTVASLEGRLDQVRAHVMAWREVRIGRVQWASLHSRKLGDPVDIPVSWILEKPSEWVLATADPSVRTEFQRLERLVSAASPLFHNFLVRHRHYWREKNDDEVLLALSLSLQLEPGCAQGAPLRALGLGGVDSKFYERNCALMTRLLDIRFAGQPTELGLEAFLGAASERDHWLLLVDLDGGLLPYRQLRIRDSELAHTSLPGQYLLIVENERCSHQLPGLPDTLAILGAGLNLAWLAAPWIAAKRVAYWGDTDTWGLTMLARARHYQPHLVPILMSHEVFEQHADMAVTELVPAGQPPPPDLSDSERELYSHLLQQQKGRLEQEFLPRSLVQQSLTLWQQGT